MKDIQFDSRTLLLFYVIPVLACSNTSSYPQEYKGAQLHEVCHSPRGDYFVVCYRIPASFASVGGSSDAEGIVCLFDSAGNLLNEKRIDMVQRFAFVDWTDDKVTIKLFAEWDLPSRTRTQKGLNRERE